MKGEAYKRNVDTQDELIARILDAAALIKKRADPQTRKETPSSYASWKVH
jgi:hypothetical protein